MRALQRNNIVDVFVWVDDSLPKFKRPGARPVLTDSERRPYRTTQNPSEPVRLDSPGIHGLLSEAPCLPELRSPLSPVTTNIELATAVDLVDSFAAALCRQYHAAGL
jgi:hypothetical protein